MQQQLYTTPPLLSVAIQALNSTMGPMRWNFFAKKMGHSANRFKTAQVSTKHEKFEFQNFALKLLNVVSNM